MAGSEFTNVVVAILILTIVIGFSFALAGDWPKVAQTLLYSIIIISVSVFSKKIVARMLDADVEHEIWNFSRYGFKPHYHFKKEVPSGIIFPLFFTLFSLGTVKLMTLLTYETRALKRRAAKRFGEYSYTEMTDWHNGIIGASGIIALFILSTIAYFLPTNLEYFAAMSSFYAFFNMIPISKLDGTQIFFGSRVLWFTLAIISLLFAFYAFPLYF